MGQKPTNNSLGKEPQLTETKSSWSGSLFYLLYFSSVGCNTLLLHHYQNFEWWRGLFLSIASITCIFFPLRMIVIKLKHKLNK